MSNDAAIAAARYIASQQDALFAQAYRPSPAVVKAVKPKPAHSELLITRLPDGGYTVTKAYNVYTDDKARAIFAATEIKDALAFVWVNLEPPETDGDEKQAA